ncbi:hypothetical protein [Parendozoicomonas sp. Alg238-R29]|uniref:hypothetical protein n=1 Tax=Parendozoicomonas sp. Alg238-R29 TaxID=2993446 RepID=UPI00248DA1B5|nr:hypothetical protein [Parendozoicomonas sp. Alg238-R29]
MTNHQVNALPQVISDVNQVHLKLQELDLTEDILLYAVLRGLTAKRSTTENHPPIAGGIMAYLDTTRFLRDQLIPKGWTRQNINNLCITRHPENTCDIVVSSGSSDTGRKDGNPSNKNPKGNSARNYIDKNQLGFWPPEETTQSKSPQNTWMLIYYIDESEGEIRLELSLPTAIDDSGYVKTWSTRLLIAAVSFDSEPEPKVFEAEFSPDIDIDILKIS